MSEPTHICEYCHRRYHTRTGKYRHENKHHDEDHDVTGMMIERARSTE